MLRVAVIGAGEMARTRARSLISTGKVVLCGVASRHLDTAGAFAREFDCGEGYDDYTRLTETFPDAILYRIVSSLLIRYNIRDHLQFGRIRMSKYVVRVENLRTQFKLDEGILKAVDGVSFDIPENTTVGVIGESGCGKSVTAQSILRIVPSPGEIKSGKILLSRNGDEPIDLASLDDRGASIRAIRGKEISMIFQEPMTSLSPVHTIGAQIAEAVQLHSELEKTDIRPYVEQMISKVGISNPSQRYDEYPHQLSGGMRQRAMIAMALSCNPRLLIADEPTTALDVTVQAQILELMKGLQDQYAMSIFYITHDLGVIAEIADEVNVMYLGRVVERAPAIQLFENPLHPYTRLLLKSIPKLGQKSKTKLEAIKGTVPIPLNPPPMCGFFSRCPDAMKGKCDGTIPALVEMEPNHQVRCFLHSDETEPYDE